MLTMFTTAARPAKDRFRSWREICEDRLVPMDQHRIGDEPFHASIHGSNIGGLEFTKFSLSNIRAATTPQTIRHIANKTDQLFLSFVLSGTVHASQNGRSTVDRPGDMTIRDPNTPWLIEHHGSTEVLAVAIPRDRLERTLGPTRRFAGLTVHGSLPTASLAQSFVGDLLRKEDQLRPAAVERLHSIAIDLIAASIAERMALDPPSLGPVTVQRAKAYIETHLGDLDLAPPGVAAAVGVSPRYLQILFREQGRSVAAWIWQRRLETAAQRLSDPAYLYVSLGDLAYRCGFTNQSHFTRRFRERYGQNPRDYRHAAFLPRDRD